MATAARTEAACMVSAITPEPHPLRTAIIRAVCAADHVHVTLANGTEAECDAADEEAFAAKQAMLAEFRKFGIGADWLGKLGAVL